jgi:hypothetical protein
MRRRSRRKELLTGSGSFFALRLEPRHLVFYGALHPTNSILTRAISTHDSSTLETVFPTARALNLSTLVTHNMPRSRAVRQGAESTEDKKTARFPGVGTER